MPALYFNSYAPLAISPAGRVASIEYKLPPFIDGSIRREPDLEHLKPSISCLCRAGKFAPRLDVGDVVVYLTKKNRYGACGKAQRHVVAILQVIQCFESHEQGAEWYRQQRLPLPSNCLVPGNEPEPFERSHRRFQASGCATNAQTHQQWEAAYQERAALHPQFVVCKPLFVDLSWSAPVITDDQFIELLDRVPSTQNPARLTITLLKRLVKLLKIEVQPFSQ